MQFYSEDDIDSEEKMNLILDTFRTCFWLQDHQWFVRCYWKTQLERKFYCLYTLPYTFLWFAPGTNMRFKATFSHDDNYRSYDRVYPQTSFNCIFQICRILVFNFLEKIIFWPVSTASLDASNVRKWSLTK
jgi:hypothetical protein